MIDRPPRRRGRGTVPRKLHRIIIMASRVKFARPGLKPGCGNLQCPAASHRVVFKYRASEALTTTVQYKL
eukprot:501975-Hanusia_phi.AAC.1